MYNFRLVQQMFKNYKEGLVNELVSPNDTMNNEWYFQVGRSAVEVVAASLMASQLQSVERVLDIPCGHGRVLRHLVHAFPEASFDVCDLDADGVDFCAATFGSRPIYSRADLTEVIFDTRYDLIWVGSLFTHTSEEITKKWLAHLSRFLKPQGIIIATFHGRWNLQVHKVAPYIADDSWKIILKDYAATGYGYHDYSARENHSFIPGNYGISRFFPGWLRRALQKHAIIPGGYGVSLAKPHVTIRNLENIPGIRIFLYMERGWSDVQDVAVYGLPGYDQPWPKMNA